ncbi:nodulation protein NfeD [Candidatus Sumerlaeota bacterium]|nr:nodulation protein NfeD [Candidatus Sumerlaeota bacterium]
MLRRTGGVCFSIALLIMLCAVAPRALGADENKELTEKELAERKKGLADKSLEQLEKGLEWGAKKVEQYKEEREQKKEEAEQQKKQETEFQEVEPAPESHAAEEGEEEGAIEQPVAMSQRQPAEPVLPDRSLRPLVYRTKLTGEVGAKMTLQVRRAIQAATDAGAAMLLLEIDTPGGDLAEMSHIKKALIQAPMVTTIYVHDAISAGALISLSCDNIYMAPGGNIGASTPILGTGQSIGSLGEDVQAKIYSFTLAEFRSAAEAKNHPVDLAEAFVDRKYEIPGIVKEGELLSLTAKEAVQAGLAIKTLDRPEDVYDDLNMKFEKEEIFELMSLDKFALAVTGYAWIFLGLGLVGLFTEMRTPGFGVPGILGCFFIGIFFWASYFLQNSGWIEIILFITGIGLLAAEIFVIPGFGVAGISGIICLTLSIFLAMFEMPQGMALTWDAVSGPIRMTGVTIIIGGALAVASMFYIRSSFFMRIVGLDATLDSKAGYVSAERRDDLIGMIGEAQSVLRPSGMVVIAGKRLDARTQGSYLEKGTRVRVIASDGQQVVVAPAPEEESKNA